MALASTIQTEVKTRLHKLNASTQMDALVLSCINQALHDLEHDTFSESPHAWTWLRRNFGFQTESGIWKYPLRPASGAIKWGSISELRIASSAYYLTPVDSKAIYRGDSDMSVTGDPLRYWIDGMSENMNNSMVVGLWPVPSAQLTIEGSYLKELPDMVAADTILLPGNAIPVLTDIASWYYAIRDTKSPEVARHYESRALAGMRALRMSDELDQDRVLVAGGASTVDYGDIESFGGVSGYGRSV